MRDNKEAVFAFTYKQEGGYGNDPYDPGGATNLGIIQREYDAYRHVRGLMPQSVRNITKAEADDIYSRYYWSKVHGDELPSGIDLVMYDYGVNSGPYRAIRYAQMVLGVKVDGLLGPITFGALREADPKQFVLEYDAKRLSFLRNLSTFWRFGGGWTRRVKAATNEALKLIGEAPKYTLQSERKTMLFDVILGIARHVITGGGIGVATSGGFDLHSPTTWFGIATFIGGAAFSAIDKVKKNGQFDLQDILLETLSSINDKLAETDKKAS